MVENNFTDFNVFEINDEPLEFHPRCLAAIPDDIQEILKDSE